VPADVEQVERLSKAKLVEMAETLKLYREHGPSAALDLIRTDIGKWTMTQSRNGCGTSRHRKWTTSLPRAVRWRIDRWITWRSPVPRWWPACFLVLLLCRLVVSYIRSKERETEDLAERGTELELLVKAPHRGTVATLDASSVAGRAGTVGSVTRTAR